MYVCTYLHIYIHEHIYCIYQGTKYFKFDVWQLTGSKCSAKNFAQSLNNFV